MQRLLRPSSLLASLALTTLFGGCQFLGGDTGEALAARKEAEGKAIGGACRHAGRAIEDCFVLNKRADKAALFAGWREMNDYMRENKIDAVPAQGAALADAGANKAAENSAERAADGGGAALASEAAAASAPKKPAKSRKQDS